MQKCSTSLTITKVQIKATKRYTSHPLRWPISLFSVALRTQMAASEGSSTSLSQPLAVRSSLKWTMNENLHIFQEKHTATEVAADALGEEWKVMWSKSVVGMINRVSPWSIFSPWKWGNGREWPVAESACSREGAFLFQTKEGWRKKAQICTGLQCGCQPECPQSGHRRKRGPEGYSWATDPPEPRHLRPERTSCRCYCRLAARSCSALCGSMDRSPSTRFLCPWDSPGKDTGVGCHFLLQRISPTQGSNPRLPNWQADSLPLAPPGKPPKRWQNPQTFLSL